MMTNEKAMNFPILTKNRKVEGFDIEKEGDWKGPFWFVHCTDTQFGMVDSFHNKNRTNPNSNAEIDLCTRLVKKLNSIKPKPRFMVITGDLIDASPITMRNSQIREFKSIFSQIDPEIKLICVCGNHDITEQPTAKDVEDYTMEFGDDYFSFYVGGVKFICINSQFYVNDSKCQNLRQQQDEWLAKELRKNESKPWKHLVGFQHIPPFTRTPNEPRVPVFDTHLSFNFPVVEYRQQYLKKLKDAKMAKIFCGHYHRNAGGFDDELEVVVTTSMGCQLGNDDQGFRVVKVLENNIIHKFYTLNAPLSYVNFNA